MRSPARFLIAALLITGVTTAAQQGSATALMAGTGHNGAVPYDVGTTPPDYESWYAIAVVEVDSPMDIPNAVIADFRLIDDKGGVIKASRILLIEAIDGPTPADVGDNSYWVKPRGVRLWEGRLPAGKIRLRIRASFQDGQAHRSNQVEGFSVKVGSYTVSGKILMRFPS